MKEIFFLPVSCEEEEIFDLFIDGKPLSQILSEKSGKRVSLDLENMQENYELLEVVIFSYRAEDDEIIKSKVSEDEYGESVVIEFLYGGQVIYRIDVDLENYKELLQILKYFFEYEYFKMLEYIISKHYHLYPQFRKNIDCFDITDEQIIKLDKNFFIKLLTSEDSIPSRQKLTKNWLDNLHLIKAGRYPEVYLPEHLKDIYKRYKNLVSSGYKPVNIKYLLFKKDCKDTSIGFKFILDREYFLFLDPQGNICFSDRNTDYVPYSLNSRILIEKKNIKDLEFGFTKILNFYNFLKFFEKKLYVPAYRHIKHHFDELQINTYISQNFDFDQLVNFVIEKDFDNFDLSESKTQIFTDQFVDYFQNNLRFFYTRVVGVRFYVEKRYIYSLKEGDPVLAVWDYKNPADKNAVMIFDKNGMQLGYLKRELAQILVKKFKTSFFLPGKIHKILDSEDPNERIFIVLKCN